MIKHIHIAKKNLPFSHQVGTEFFLAGSSLSVKVFPCRFELTDLSNPTEKTNKILSLSLLGPCHNFTILQDIEKKTLSIFGSLEEGYVRYEFFFEEKNLYIILKKGPSAGIPFEWQNKKSSLLPKEKFLLISSCETVFSPNIEKLSLGSHKSLDWELVLRRKDLKEIFPVWFELGQLAPNTPITKKGNGYLLNTCHELIIQEKKTELEKAFLSLFLSSFSGVFVPALEDRLFQGLLPMQERFFDANSHLSLFLLREGAKAIRSCFIKQTSDRVSILPCLPPSFHEGRMTNITLENVGMLDIEWSKKILRRMECSVTEDATIFLDLQSSIKSFRLRSSNKDRGKECSFKEPLILEKGKTYFLDHFQK